MEEDDILYQSIIADPEQVSPDVDVSGLRTQTETSPQLLAAVSEYPGLQFDPTQYSAYSDLMDLYSTGLPMIETSTVETPAITTPVVETEGGGGGSQGTGDLVQDLVPTEDEQIITPTTEPNVFEGSPFIETSPNVLSAVNAAGEPIPGNIVDPATGNVFAPGDYSDVAGTVADPKEVIDVARPVSSTLPVSDQIDMEQSVNVFDITPEESGAGSIAQETFLPDYDFTPQTTPLDTAGTGDAEIALDITAQDRAAADIPEIGLDSEYIVPTEGVIPTEEIVSPQEFILPAQKPIDYSAIDAQTADELAQQFTPEQIQAAQDPENVSLYNQVIQGAKTAGEFIADRGVDLYNLYNLVQGGFAGAIGGLNLLGLNPVTGLLQVASSAITNTPSAQEYDSYSDAQKLEINKAYGPGGVMEGYNAVSQFGKGALATVEKRIEDRASLGIFDDTTEKLNNLAESLGGNRIDPPAYDFDDRSDQEQMTFDLDKADEAFAETGDYDEYSGIDTGFTGPDYGSITSGTVFDAEDEEDYSTSPTVDTTATPAYDFDDDFYDSEPAPAPSPAPAPASDPRDRGGGGGGGGGNGKIVCTMMHETYGFGSFRNKIWIKYAQDNFTPEYEKGYHKIFLPLVSYAKKKGVTNKIVKKILEHIAVHRTIDIRQESRGKTHMLGRVYRKVLEPICYLVGKYAKR